MGSGRKRIGLLEVLGYLLGGALLVLAATAASDRAPLYLVVGLAAGGMLTILGSITFLGNRRILPVGVTRDADTITCRYIPWYELNSYTAFVLVPLIGFTALGAGSTPGKPGWLTFFGVLILGTVLIAGYFAVQMWRRCLVMFSPTSLTVRLPARGSLPTDIRRSHVQSISSADAEVGAAFAPVTVSQVAIAYQGADHSAGTTTVLLGPPPGKTALQVSVPPTNLYNALQAWRDAASDDPGLMDRVEKLLRGQTTA